MRMWLFGMAALLVGCTGKDKPVDTGDTSIAVDDDQDDDGFTGLDDCDDLDPASHLGATEVWYDGVDQDCLGDSDYDQDKDGVDGEGTGADCDDLDAAVFPGADELCDAVDNDCDLEVDEEGAIGGVAVYVDLDGDGFGEGAEQGSYCEAPVGTALVDGDCDDTRPEVNPDAAEMCDDLDNDCSGFVDDEPVDGADWFPDFDADGFGDGNAGVRTCEQPEGYVADTTDCDDADALSYPGAPEVCDLEDNNCDGAVDEGATDMRTYYGDADADGYGEPSTTTLACGAPAGFAETDDDCADADAAINPGAYEACDSVDNDCDGEIDSDSPDAVAYHPDVDGDSYGDASTTQSSCSAVSGWLTDGSDCDDTDAAASPVGIEVCDGSDDDCDGMTDESDATDALTWYIDADADGFGSAAVVTTSCDEPLGYDDDSDCDDAEPAANPGARETCDGLDNDCDGTTDEDDASGAPTWYVDADADGYGDTSNSSVACDQPSGYIAMGEDCDDADAAINPAAVETRDLVDEDCDGYVDEDFIVAGDIVISEIARQPYTGGTGLSANANAQWFEVTNTSSSDIDISNWYVEEQVGDSFYVSADAGVVVPAGGFVTFCYDDQWFATPSDCDYTWGDAGWGTGYYDSTYYFDRDDDLTALYMGGALMDEVEYQLGADASGDSWPRVARYSMRLSNDAYDIGLNDDAGAWCLAEVSTIYSLSTATGYPDYGTPGTDNGACP